MEHIRAGSCLKGDRDGGRLVLFGSGRLGLHLVLFDELTHHYGGRVEAGSEELLSVVVSMEELTGLSDPLVACH